MSDNRNYPTRMHEILGVQTGQEFSLDSHYPLYVNKMDDYGTVRDNFGREVGASVIADMVNHPERIIRKPRLTEEQIAQLKALMAFTMKWMAKDMLDHVYAYNFKPQKSREEWVLPDDLIGHGTSDYMELPHRCAVFDLVSWFDDEPLDIAQCLRDNGVEVE